jgi:hypothetical protein
MVSKYKVLLYIVCACATMLLTSVASASNDTARHWADGGGGPGYVNVVDNTAVWPVKPAVDEWDHAGRLQANYRTACQGAGHCVGLSAVSYLGGFTCHELQGVTVTAANSNNHLLTQTFIEINNHCRSDPHNHPNSELRVITCHEIGHALSLAHVAADQHSTCMANGTMLSPPQSNTPRQHDFVMLDDNMYDHTD